MGGDGEIDFMAHLEQKRRDMAVMQECANVAKEQAAALLRLQRRTAEIDALANGTATPATSSTAAAPAVSRRDFRGPPSRAPAATPTYRPAVQAVLPETGSSLSAEDRARFGLDQFETPPSDGIAAKLKQAEEEARFIKEEAPAVLSVTRSLNGVGSPPQSRQELKMDPEDRQVYSLDQLRLKYKATFSAAEIEDYFLKMCVPTPDGHPSRVFAKTDVRAEAEAPHQYSYDGHNEQHRFAADSSATGTASEAPQWTSLSAEDRKRFGLDVVEVNPSPKRGGSGREILRYPAAAYPPMEPVPSAAVGFAHHPEVLWDDATINSGSQSMARTIAQLEAVGATKLVADLKETERRLQSCKFRA